MNEIHAQDRTLSRVASTDALIRRTGEVAGRSKQRNHAARNHEFSRDSHEHGVQIGLADYDLRKSAAIPAKLLRTNLPVGRIAEEHVYARNLLSREQVKRI